MTSVCVRLPSNDGFSFFELCCLAEDDHNRIMRGVITMMAQPVLDRWDDNVAWSVVLNGLRIGDTELKGLLEIFANWGGIDQKVSISLAGCDTRVSIAVACEYPNFIVERSKKVFAVSWDGIATPGGRVVFAIDESCAREAQAGIEDALRLCADTS